jgi:hypothetical protein
MAADVPCAATVERTPQIIARLALISKMWNGINVSRTAYQRGGSMKGRTPIFNHLLSLNGEHRSEHSRYFGRKPISNGCRAIWVFRTKRPTLVVP